MRFEVGQEFEVRAAGGTLNFAVTEVLGPGGQGWGYLAREVDRGWAAFAKTFHSEFVTDETGTRTRWLAAQGVDDPGLLAPRYVIEDRGRVVGHVAPAVRGARITDALFPSDGQSGPTLPERLGIARDLFSQLRRLHERGIAHGDLSGGNILVDGERRPHFIDFDNFTAHGVPLPKMQGTPRYTAPWVLAGTTPDLSSDVFSAAVLLHEALLGRHPFIPPEVGSDEEGLRMQEALMKASRWLDHPRISLLGHRQRGGAPLRWLSPGLIQLLSGVFSGARITTARQFEEALRVSASRDCSSCGEPALFDAGGACAACPWCGMSMGRVLRASWGRRAIALSEGEHLLGRAQIDLPDISRHHVRLIFLGERVTLEDLSSFGTWVGGRKMGQGPLEVRPPCSLRMGSIQVSLSWL